MRGRKPKPLALREAEGDTRKIGAKKLRLAIAAEPNATRGLPECPKHLTGRARAAWKFWATELADMGLDRRPDAMMLEGACVAYARAVDADVLIERDGLIVEEPITDREGEVIGTKTKRHEAIPISDMSWKQVRAFCSEFGLSPVSRTRLAAENRDPHGQDLAAILAQPRQPRPAPPTVQ